MIKVIGILETILTVILKLAKSKVFLILHITQIRHMHVFNSCIDGHIIVIIINNLKRQK